MRTFDNQSAGRRWRFRRNLVLYIAHKQGVSTRLLADVFDLTTERTEAIVREWQDRYDMEPTLATENEQE